MALGSVFLRLQDACARGEGSARSWLDRTRRRAAALDAGEHALNAILEWNPAAEAIASALDGERRASGPRGPLHGVPVLLKDNLDTADATHTSAGSLALADRLADRDAFVARRLREAGAVLCGKTNMTELAGFMARGFPPGYSSRGGQVRHAWKAGVDPRGSSTGSAVAVAAGYVPLAIGTETIGSIIAPAAAAGVVALRPTLGRISRSGILPLAPSMDVPGPMARTVLDCALALSILAGPDPDDPVTAHGAGHALPGPDLLGARAARLDGVRLGLYTLDEEDREVRHAAFHEAVRALESLGAEVVPFRPPAGAARDLRTLFLHEFRPAMDRALRRGRGGARTVAEIHAYNLAHADRCLRHGQGTLDEALALPRPMETPDYARARETARAVVGALERSFEGLSLSAVLSHRGLAAFPVAGCPALTLPAGLDAEGLPVPVVLEGLRFSEGALLRVGAALEATVGSAFRPAWMAGIGGDDFPLGAETR